MKTKRYCVLALVLLSIALLTPGALQAQGSELHFFAGSINRIRTTARHADLAFQSSGGLLGVRFSQRLAGPISAEGAFAFSNAGRDSVVGFFEGSPGQLDRHVFVLPLSGGNTFLFEGGLRIDVLRAKRFAPYVAVGAGTARRTRILSASEVTELMNRVNLGGFTSFPVTGFIVENNTDFMVAAGGGVRFLLGKRWGIRGEFRGRNDRWTSLEFFGGPFFEF